MLTSWSEQSTPAELSIASVLMRPPADAYSMRPSWVRPRLPPSPTTRARSSRPSTRIGVVVAIADLGMRLVGGLDERADAAVPEQVDGRAQDRAHELVRIERLGLDAQGGAHLGRERHRLLGARPHAAAGRDERRGRSPSTTCRRRARRAARARRTTAAGVGRRVEEDVAVVERRDELDLAREQHAVAEDVAGHVADADDRERARVDVAAELAEVPLDALPGAARRDAELLVVVALGAARGERVAEPEAVLERDRVGGVRERGGALVGRHDEVRIVLVEGAHARRAHDLAADDVVGHVEHAADQRRVAQLHLGAQRVAVGRRGAQHEPALGADRHDHGVLDHLGLHQPEHLGAVVLAAIRPADAAARDVTAAQVDALDLRVVDEDLEERRGRGHLRHVGRAQLEREVRRARAPRSCARWRRSAPRSRAGCGPRRGCPTAASCSSSSRAQLRLARLVGGLAEARAEQLDERARRLRMRRTARRSGTRR